MEKKNKNYMLELELQITAGDFSRKLELCEFYKREWHEPRRLHSKGTLSSAIDQGLEGLQSEYSRSKP